MRHQPPDRAEVLRRLKAFGLFVRGDITLYRIAERIGIAEQNPSTAACRARTKIEQGWRLVRELPRWERYKSQVMPSVYGARLLTHPRIEPTPVVELTPFERLLSRLEDIEHAARRDGFFGAADGIRNLRAALRYNASDSPPTYARRRP